MKHVAIITGASKGIGAATAKCLAAKDFSVCINYHESKIKADEIVDEINKSGGKAIAVQANIASEKEIMQLFKIVDEQLGTVTALVNNAGINGGICEVEHMSVDALQSVFATNVFGTFFCCREAIKRMKKNGGGNIVNISSEAARFGGTKLTHYAASKAAINTFTIGAAREVAEFNIRINTVSPGIINTEMHATSPPDRIENLLKTLPTGRMGTAQEVAETIAWLISPKAGYISGAIIPVTGAR